VGDAIEIGRETGIVILESNYANLDREPWEAAAKLFDVRLMVVVDRAVARERLVERHVRSGICGDEANARWRVDNTDDLNAEEILGYRVEGVSEVVLLDYI
jgi:pantothenate kinase